MLKTTGIRSSTSPPALENMLLIRRLLQQGEDINAKNRAGQTALDIAEQYQKSEVVMELSRHGAQR